MMTSGYHVLGASDDLESRVQAVGKRIEPWFWIITILTFAMTTTRFVMALRGHSRHGDAW